jgi:hypothetical protein
LLRGTQALQYLVGRTVLAGVTVRDRSGAILRREQFFGVVTEVVDGVVVIGHPDGTETVLPAEPSGYSAAPRGRYTLASGGVVVDPDYLSTWDVSPGPD